VSKVFVDVGMSLDGFIAGPNGGPDNPMGGASPRIHGWIFPLATFHERLGWPGGATGPDDDLVKEVFARSGANIMGRRMFDEGEVAWPENAPFRTSVFVLTHKPRDPWPRPGGTTFYFVTDGIESALEQAREAAGDLDIRISGGAATIAQYLNAGLVDEMMIHVAPVLVGEGIRLFDGVSPDKLTLEPTGTIASQNVTHLAFSVAK
jgi:dihydrofolate reductase